MNRKPPPAPTGHKDGPEPPAKRGKLATPSRTGPASAPVAPAVPSALLQLVHIAEMSGLLTSSDPGAMLAAFADADREGSAIAIELDRFTLTLTDLYVLVTLFSAAPRPVPLAVLSRETTADPLSIRDSLDHLSEMEAIMKENSVGAEPSLELTSSGQSLAVLVMYRVSNASILRG